MTQVTFSESHLVQQRQRRLEKKPRNSLTINLFRIVELFMLVATGTAIPSHSRHEHEVCGAMLSEISGGIRVILEFNVKRALLDTKERRKSETFVFLSVPSFVLCSVLVLVSR